MKVMRERRFLVAWQRSKRSSAGSAGTSSAILGDDGDRVHAARCRARHAVRCHGGEVVLPAREQHRRHFVSSRVLGDDPLDFLVGDLDELADFSICLTLNDTVVVDPTNARLLGAGNREQGPLINLTGRKGIVTVTGL